MRIRVLLDVTKPLKRREKIKKPGGDSGYIKFNYERLGNYCYFCGLLGHIEDFGEKLYDLPEDDGTRLWGPELRVDKQCSSGGSTGKTVDSSGVATIPASVSVHTAGNSSTLKESLITPKPAALANLLRNPNLKRTIKNAELVSEEFKNNHSELLQENHEAALSLKSKRSRMLNAEEQ